MTTTLSATEQRERVRQLIEQGLDEQDPEVVREVFADEVEMMSRPGSMPVDAVITNLLLYYEAIPDLEHIIHDLWTDEDAVVVHYSNVGTFENELVIEEGPMAGLQIEPTGAEVEYNGVYLGRFDDEEIAEWMNYPERMRVLQQMGIIPSWDELVD